jgi:flotillin
METSMFFIAGAIVILAIVFIGLLNFVARNYIKVPPNQVAVFFGRKNKIKTSDGEDVVKGFRVVTGGAKFRVPFIERVAFLDLTVFSIDVNVTDAPNKDGVPVTLRAVANVKIKSEEAALMAACERFLGRSQEEIKLISQRNLEGHLRSIAGRMTVEELVGDRAKLNAEILNDAAADLIKMGLGVDLLTVSEITDKYGYIDQLGKKRTAEVVRDAEIGKAEAEKESVIRTTTAQRLSREEANKNLVAIAESDKLRDVRKAEFNAEVDTQQMVAANAGPISDATQKQKVIAQETEIERIRISKLSEVAEVEIARREKELTATVIKPAEAARESEIIKAQGARQVSITEAEGRAKAIEMIADAEKKKLTLEGEGQANATRARLLAEAEGIKAKLLAEAEGVLKKAEAYAKLDETGKLLQILEVVEKVLPGAIKEFAGVMQAAAQPLSNIKDVKIIDFGGQGNGGGTSLSRFGQIAPEMVMKFVTALQGTGIDPADLFQKLGINLENFVPGNALGVAKSAADKDALSVKKKTENDK